LKDAEMTKQESGRSRLSRGPTVEQWLEERKLEALRIDPATALVCGIHCPVDDPYGVMGPDGEEAHCIGLVFFARAPDAEFWVWFGDLPEVTVLALRERGESAELEAFASLEDWDF
jgi:hypothetical protein